MKDVMQTVLTLFLTLFQTEYQTFHLCNNNATLIPYNQSTRQSSLRDKGMVLVFDRVWIQWCMKGIWYCER